MRKGWLVLLAMALVVALAVPASAEMKLNGFYRVKPTVSNFVGNGNNNLNVPGMQSAAAASLIKTGSTGIETDRTRSFTEMRNRLRFEIGDENVKGVTFFEIDGNFGDIAAATAGRNQGLASNGDSINIETKNLFVWFKVPNTSWNFTVGLQGYSDEFAGLIFGYSDQAGVVANFKYDPVNFRLTWLKIRDDITLNAEGTVTAGAATENNWATSNAGGNEADYYAIDAKLTPTKDTAATLHFGFLRDTNSFVSEPTEAAGLESLKAYYLGLNGTIKLAPATVTAYFLYNFGKFEDNDTPAAQEVKIAGFAFGARADAKAGPGNAFLELLYVSGDNDNTVGSKYKSVVTGSDFANLTSYYARPDLTILFPNIDMINSATALVLNPNNAGRGLILVAAGYTQKFSDKITGKVGAGYLAADKKRPLSAATEAKGKSMATEINANVNYNISKGLDFGVYGAYALLGSFYDRPAGQDSPSDLYTFHGRLNYAF
jgi:hypothetical protein